MGIEINGLYWDIVLTYEYEELKRNDGSMTLGITDVSQLKIFIYAGLSDYMFRRVLIHELTHAWMFSYRFYLNEKEQEMICQFVENYSEDILSSADSLIYEGLRKLKII